MAVLKGGTYVGGDLVIAADNYIGRNLTVYGSQTTLGKTGLGTGSPTTIAHVYGTLTVDAAGQALNSYSEGIRMGRASNGCSIVVFATDPSAASGSYTGSFWAGRASNNTFAIANQTGVQVFELSQAGLLTLNQAVQHNFGSGTLAADQFIATNNSNGTNFRIGDDAWLGDISVTNTAQLNVITDETKGALKLGTAGPTLYGGQSGTGVGSLSIGTTSLPASGNAVLTLAGAISMGGDMTSNADACIHIRQSYGLSTRIFQTAPTSGVTVSNTNLAGYYTSSALNWFTWGVDASITAFKVNPSINFASAGFLAVGSDSTVFHNQTNVGASLGNASSSFYLTAGSGNIDNLIINDLRWKAGSTWTTAGYRLQQKVDVTWMAWMQFNGPLLDGTTANSGGISWGAGTSTAGGLPTDVPTKMTLDTSGNLSLVGKIRENGNDLLPVGTLLPNAGFLIPSGFLPCDGSSYLRSAYPALTNILYPTFGLSVIAGSPTGTYSGLPGIFDTSPMFSRGYVTYSLGSGPTNLTAYVEYWIVHMGGGVVICASKPTFDTAGNFSYTPIVFAGYTGIFSVTLCPYGLSASGSGYLKVPNLKSATLRAAGANTVDYAGPRFVSLGETIDDSLQQHTHNYNTPPQYGGAADGPTGIENADWGTYITTGGSGRMMNETTGKAVGVNYIIKY